MSETAREELERVIRRLVEEYTPGEFIEDWDLEGMAAAVVDLWDTSVGLEDIAAERLDRDDLVRLLHEDALRVYDAREAELGEELMRALERYLLLQIIDQQWREHLYDMDYLREGIHLRGFAQIDPIIAYKNEAFELFTDLMNGLWTRFAQMIFNVEVEVESQDGGSRQQAPPPQWTGNSGTATGTGASRVTYSGGAGSAQPSALATAAGASAMSPEGMVDDDGVQAVPTVETRHLSDEEQIGRNDPCWCGSGKKFKKCHGS